MTAEIPVNKSLESKIIQILKTKNISFFDLEKEFNYSRGGLNDMIKGKRPFLEKIKKKLLPILEVSRQEFEAWILADKYSKEILELATQAKKENKNKDKKLILTFKIDEILEIKGLSRTALSKQINHSQSGLNRVISGKEPLSKNLATKLSSALGVPVEHLQAWVLADKYSKKILELTLQI